MPTDFEVLIASVGENSTARLRRLGLLRLRVLGMEALGTATIYVTLADPGWDNQGLALDAIQDVFEMFLDELALDVRFERPTPQESPAELDVKPELEFA